VAAYPIRASDAAPIARVGFHERDDVVPRHVQSPSGRARHRMAPASATRAASSAPAHVHAEARAILRLAASASSGGAHAALASTRSTTRARARARRIAAPSTIEEQAGQRLDAAKGVGRHAARPAVAVAVGEFSRPRRSASITSASATRPRGRRPLSMDTASAPAAIAQVALRRGVSGRRAVLRTWWWRPAAPSARSISCTTLFSIHPGYFLA